MCVNYCVCLFFDLGGSISRNLREKGKYINKKFFFWCYATSKLAKGCARRFFVFLYITKEGKKMMNVIYWRSLVWKKDPWNRMKSLPCPLWCQKYGKNKSFKKRTPKKQIEQKNYRIPPRLTTTTITHNFKINEF